MVSFKGEKQFLVDQAEVWACLNEPDKMSRCLPGLQKIELAEDRSQFTAVMQMGPFKAQAVVAWLEQQPPDYGRFTSITQLPAKGGRLRINGQIRVEKEGTGSRLFWQAEVDQFEGLLVMVKPMIEKSAPVVIDQFFTALKVEAERDLNLR